MPSNLHRLYGLGHLHFITFSCYGREPLLDTVSARNLFVEILHKIRSRHQFRLVGYVVMPEHVHLLISEPAVGNPSTAIMALKYCTAREFLGRRRLLEQPRNWQSRFHDFNVYSSHKKEEKLHYMHENPVTRHLVRFPADWIWSSFSFYVTGQPGLIAVDLVD